MPARESGAWMDQDHLGRNALLPAIEIRPRRFESLDKTTKDIYHYKILEMSVSELRK